MENLRLTAPGFEHLTELLRTLVTLDLFKYGSEIIPPSSFASKLLLVVSLVSNIIDGNKYL